MTDRFIIYVFSFNRAQFLRNCIDSILACVTDTPVVIVDDNSNDADTVSVLSDLSSKYSIIMNSEGRQYEFKTGGLAGAMNLALLHAQENEYRYAIFIQDDMQFVRSFGTEDREAIADYFRSLPNTFQLSTNFIRELSVKGFLHDHRIDGEARAYIRLRAAERGKSNFSATGVFDVERFHSLFKKIQPGEGENSERARLLGLTCGRALYPFMCWLPYPLSYRGKRRNLGHFLFEYFGHSGYHPIRMMTDSEAQRFLRRDPNLLPVMERFLDSPRSPRKDIWSTGGGEYNFVAYGSIPARVFRWLRARKRALIHQRGTSKV